MKKRYLNITQRLIAVALYLGILFALCLYFSKDISFLWEGGNRYNILFCSVALVLIMGTYIAEPYFTYPTDVLMNSISIFLILLGIGTVKNDFLFYNVFFIISIFLIVLSLVAIISYKRSPNSKFSKFLFRFLTTIGKSKVSYSVIYIATLFSFFFKEQLFWEFSAFLTFWLIFITQNFVESIILWCSSLITALRKQTVTYLGEAIGCENPFLYRVERDFSKHNKCTIKRGALVSIQLEKGLSMIGIVVDVKNLLNKEWLLVYILNKNGNILKINLNNEKLANLEEVEYSESNAVFLLNLDDIKSQDIKDTIQRNKICSNRNEFIGYVDSRSDNSNIRVHLLLDNQKIKEGDIIQTQIYNDEVIYQVLSGESYRENLENEDSSSYSIAFAAKLGKYDKNTRSLEEVNWMPDMFSPVYFLSSDITENLPEKRIGLLPNTKYEIDIKDYNSLITHNTAILGILGIGKSCLTFELLKKIITNTQAKIICIDITNQYLKQLPLYLVADSIQNDLPQESKTELDNTKDTKGIMQSSDESKWGNKDKYREILKKDLKSFLDNTEKRVLILNPDMHNVKQAATSYKIEALSELTPALKTRIIAEEVFKIAKSNWDLLPQDQQEENLGRTLLVLEEAHSLIPEWNSVADDGDKNAVNGTAKIILQGRKYGLGSFVITQRTANVSKSILNQCNTVFALRVFDDTGKEFLENYFGTQYANSLPELPERHSVIFGKALSLKRPLIIKLNEKEEIQNS